MYWIVPKFKKIFEDFGTDLPAMTQIVISSSDAFASHWYITLPSLLAVWGLMTTAALLPFAGGMSGFREWLSRLWPRVCLPDVLRGLALTTEARLPLEEALVPFIRWQLQVPLHSRLVRVQEAVREGHDCWGELVDEKLLTPEEAGLLQSAQRAGNLPWALNALSARVERRWQFTFLFCLEFVRPALLIAVGFVVAAFDTAMFLPLVKLINDLS
jgi:type II secretory pathway component PulF